jgi:Fic family protein
MTNLIDIPSTPFSFNSSLSETIDELQLQVQELRCGGKLTPEVLHTLRNYFRVKNIYHSNAIEGNLLSVGETRQVVEFGMTITGIPLKDQAEAKNLAHALDFLEELAVNPLRPITETDIRQLHLLVLKDIDVENPGNISAVQVEISRSDFKPPGPESVSAEMSEFGNWLNATSVAQPGEFGNRNALLMAAVAHTWFVQIHPFVDGNGRVGRLLMNLILVRYGFPIAIIAKEDRLRYYDSLEESQASDLSSFLTLLTECIHESLEEYLRAAKEQSEKTEWLASLAEKFTAREKTKAANEYEVWKSAMDLLKGYFRQTADMLNEMAQIAQVYVRDFGTLEFEKYISLKSGESVKKTWFFRIDFRSGEKSARYLFFFGSPSYHLKRQSDVTLFLAREEPSGSFHYERLDDLSAPNVPSVVELGYKQAEETFVSRDRSGNLTEEKLDVLGRRFFEEVIEMHFRN